MLLALLAGGVDQTAMAALLPAIIREFALPFDRLDEAAWAVTLYLGAYAAVLALAGRAVDRGAGIAVRIGAIVLFGIGSIGSALSQDIWPLIASRTVQGLGAGVLVPLALAEAASASDPDRRLKRLGVVMLVAEGGAVLGPLYGAAILAVTDWRWAFWLNVPVVLALLGAWGPRLRAADLVRLWRSARASDLLVGIAVGTTIVGISREGVRHGAWIPWASVAVAIAALVLAARLAGWHLSGARAGPAAAIAAHLCLGVALITPLVLVPVWASTLLGRSPAAAALVLLRLMLAVPPCALIGAFVATRLGRRAVAGGGFLLAAIGLAVMSRWSAGIGEDGMTPALVIAGAGFGLLLSPTIETLIARDDAHENATRLGWATAARVVGMAVGLAAMTTWGIDRLTERLRSLSLPLPIGGEDAATFAARVESYRRAATDIGIEIFGTLFVVGAIAAVLGAVAAIAAVRSASAQRAGRRSPT